MWRFRAKTRQPRSASPMCVNRVCYPNVVSMKKDDSSPTCEKSLARKKLENVCHSVLEWKTKAYRSLLNETSGYCTEVQVSLGLGLRTAARVLCSDTTSNPPRDILRNLINWCLVNPSALRRIGFWSGGWNKQYTRLAQWRVIPKCAYCTPIVQATLICLESYNRR